MLEFSNFTYTWIAVIGTERIAELSVGLLDGLDADATGVVSRIGRDVDITCWILM